MVALEASDPTAGALLGTLQRITDEPTIYRHAIDLNARDRQQLRVLSRRHRPLDPAGPD